MEQLRILLVEDSPSDARLISLWLSGSSLIRRVEQAGSGEVALQRLRDASQPLPDLVLLDVNLTGISGLAVLESCQADPRLEQLPVILLTGSHSQAERQQARELGASLCLTKPVDADEFESLVASIESFWQARR